MNKYEIYKKYYGGIEEHLRIYNFPKVIPAPLPLVGIVLGICILVRHFLK